MLMKSDELDIRGVWRRPGGIKGVKGGTESFRLFPEVVDDLQTMLTRIYLENDS